MHPAQHPQDRYDLARQPGTGATAMPGPAPGSADLIHRRHLEKMVAWTGLERHNQCNAKGENETIYLERLREELAKGQCPAYGVIEKWMGEWNYDVKRLIEGTAYRLPDEE